MAEPLLQARGLRVELRAGKRPPQALLRGLDLEVAGGGAVALVGESGSGKTITALALLDLLPAGAAAGGEVRWRGTDLAALPPQARRRVRGRGMTLVPQEPAGGLDPVLRAGEQVAETLRRHQGLGRAAAARRTLDLLAEVRLPDPATQARAYPHQLSGGMRQRVLIAAALACEPDLLIADEPTTALDVTVQAEIVQLLRRLRRERGMALLHITHDLALAASLAGRVEVLCAGVQVESGPVREVLRAPAHPYTRLLLSSLPETWPEGGPPEPAAAPVPAAGEEAGEAGEAVGEAAGQAAGCPFRLRCPRARAVCGEPGPGRTAIGPGHWAACLPEVAAGRERGVAP